MSDRNLGFRLNDGGEIAFVLRGQVQNNDKRDAAIGCDVAEKFLEGGDAAGRGADSDYQKVGFPASCAAGLPEAAVVSSLLIDDHAREYHHTNSHRIETPICLES